VAETALAVAAAEAMSSRGGRGFFFFFWVITLSWVDSSGQSFYRVGFALASSLESNFFHFISRQVSSLSSGPGGPSPSSSRN
jgi:hypothetical protein